MSRIAFHLTGDALWNPMERAVEQVRRRLEKTAQALERGGIAYAVVEGNAVRAWVAQKDRMHLRDLIDVELVDASWRDRLAPELAACLQQLLDDPNG